MIDLKFWNRIKKEPELKQEDSFSNTKSTSTFEVVEPHTSLVTGRQLSFLIDEDSIQSAAAFRCGSFINLLEISKEYLPKSDQADQERLLFLRKSIDNFTKKYGGRKPSISVIISGSETALRTATLPEMKKDELRSSIHYETKQQIPFPIEDCQFDYRVVQKMESDEHTMVRANILAATQKLIDEALEPFELLSLEVSNLFHEQDVTGPLLRELPNFDKNISYTLINIMQYSTKIAFYRGSDLEFFHHSSLGSSFLANRSDPTMFEYFAESLATEIQNSLDYYTGQYTTQLANEIYIYGDMAYSDEIIALLSDHFGFTFKRFPTELLSFIKDGKYNDYESLTVCLPVLAAVSRKFKTANLLPGRLKKILLYRKIDRLAIAALVILCTLLGTQWAMEQSSIAASQIRLLNHERQIAEFKATEAFATYNHLKRRIASGQSFMEMAREYPSYLGLNLKELSQITPDAVRLYDLGYQTNSDQGNYQIAGIIITKKTPPAVVLAEFVENLMNSPFYDNVKVNHHIKRIKNGRFEMEFDLSLTGII